MMKQRIWCPLWCLRILGSPRFARPAWGSRMGAHLIHGRGSGYEQRDAFSLLGRTSLVWRPSRLPPLPHGHAERLEDEAVATGDGSGMAEPSSASWRRWRTTVFLSPIVCWEAGLEQSWLTLVEKHGEIQEHRNKLWQGLSLLPMVSVQPWVSFLSL